MGKKTATQKVSDVPKKSIAIADAPKVEKAGKSKVPDQVAVQSWTRIAKGGANTKADTREVDDKYIESLLIKRREAKTKKDYGVADAIANELQAMNVCYIDEKMEWYTKAVSEKAPEPTNVAKKRKGEVVEEEEQEEDEPPTSDDDDSEEEREDSAFVAKMQAKLSKSSGEKVKGEVSRRKEETKKSTQTEKKKIVASEPMQPKKVSGQKAAKKQKSAA